MKKQQLENGEQQPIQLENENEILVEPLPKPKEPMSAYQYFIEEKRQEMKFNLAEFGAMWKNLPLDYKEKFQNKAKEDKERYEKEMVLYKQQNPENEYRFPLSRLKHILSHDEDSRKISKDAYAIMLRSVELFGEQLAQSVKLKVKKDAKKEVEEEDLFTIIKELEEFDFLETLTHTSMKKKQIQKQNKHLPNSQEHEGEKDEKIGQSTIQNQGLLKYFNK